MGNLVAIFSTIQFRFLIFVLVILAVGMYALNSYVGTIYALQTRTLPYNAEQVLNVMVNKDFQYFLEQNKDYLTTCVFSTPGAIESSWQNCVKVRYTFPYSPVIANRINNDRVLKMAIDEGKCKMFYTETGYPFFVCGRDNYGTEISNGGSKTFQDIYDENNSTP